jgi:hypothetical protein
MVNSFLHRGWRNLWHVFFTSCFSADSFALGRRIVAIGNDLSGFAEVVSNGQGAKQDLGKPSLARFLFAQ